MLSLTSPHPHSGAFLAIIVLAQSLHPIRASLRLLRGAAGARTSNFQTNLIPFSDRSLRNLLHHKHKPLTVFAVRPVFCAESSPLGGPPANPNGPIPGLPDEKSDRFLRLPFPVTPIFRYSYIL
jgi:hypothetical protein